MKAKNDTHPQTFMAYGLSRKTIRHAIGNKRTGKLEQNVKMWSIHPYPAINIDDDQHVQNSILNELAAKTRHFEVKVSMDRGASNRNGTFV